MLAPSFTAPAQLDVDMRERGYAVLSPDAVCKLAGCTPEELMSLNARWNSLAPDTYLKDGGHYRKRRHSSFVAEGETVTLAPHRAHWQPVEYNALHGGMQRWFEPVAAEVAQSHA